MNVLGIESSCDETAMAVYSSERGLISHQVYSQILKHREYGGVVPELAARDHVSKLVPLTELALADAGISKRDLSAVAYTAGPGLVGALMVGAAYGRSLAFGLGVPAIEVHHMEAHLMAAMLEEDRPVYPYLALLVSGGHTLLVHVKEFGYYDILGQSLDDAVGEAFDKTAKLLGLPYPGGPELAKLALQGDDSRFDMPRPMTSRPGCDFSFSGLKTHALNCYTQYQNEINIKANIAASFQKAVVDTLLIKCKRAIDSTGLTQLAIVGGVSANQLLRDRCKSELSDLGVAVYYPRHEFCTDNGAMVAYTGYLQLTKNQIYQNPAIAVRARWPMPDLQYR